MSSARVNKKLLNRWRLDRYSSSSTTNGNRATNFSSRSVQPLLSSRFSRSQTNRGSFLASLSTNDTYIKKRCDDDERAENKSSKSSSFLSHLSLFAAAADPSTATTALETVNNNTTTTIDPTIWNYFLQTLISTTVPSVVICSCVGITVLLLRQSPQQKDKKSTSLTSSSYTRNNAARELYDDLYAPISKKEREPPLKELARMLRESSSPSKSTEAKEIRRLNKGIPAQEFIRVKHWNQILDSYQYSLTVATQSKAKAAAWLRSQNFDRALGRAFHPATLVKNSFSNHTKQQLLNLEKTFLKEGSKLVQQIQHLQTQLTQTVIDKEISNMGIENCYEMDPKVVERDSDSDQEQKEGDKDPGNPSVQDIAEQKDLMTMKERKSREKMMSELSQAQNDLMQLELSFVSDVISTMGSQYAAGIRTALLGDIAARGSGGLLTQLQERPLTSILEALESTRDDNSQGAENVPDSDSAMNNSSIDLPMPRKKNNPGTLFVSRFSGDIRASQVTKLREEVTAILRNARPGIDEALVVLESGGGTVTGYGLAAGQLQRLKDHGIKLTIAVEQVAASGGYMMCCVADRIVGSPFAIFGSIGVLTEIPNVYDRLKREGV